MVNPPGKMKGLSLRAVRRRRWLVILTVLISVVCLLTAIHRYRRSQLDELAYRLRAEARAALEAGDSRVAAGKLRRYLRRFGLDREALEWLAEARRSIDLQPPALPEGIEHNAVLSSASGDSGGSR